MKKRKVRTLRRQILSSAMQLAVLREQRTCDEELVDRLIDRLYDAAWDYHCYTTGLVWTKKQIRRIKNAADDMFDFWD